MEIKLEHGSIGIHVMDALSSDKVFQYFHISRKTRYEYYRKECVKIDNTIIKQNTQIAKNTWIWITPMYEEDQVQAWRKPLDIAYEDDLFLLVNKPVGLIIHSDGTDTNTLDQMVKHYYETKYILAPVRAIHRLDKETSGLVVYCKIPFFQPYIDHLLETKQIERIYLAIVKGKLEQKEMVIEKAIARDRHDAKKMRISPQGSFAYTKIFRKKLLHDATLVECHLKSGRTHQIRVHLASIQHPLLSDSLYGNQDARIHRCALHAWKIRILHPLTQTPMEVVCEMPNDMLSLIKANTSSNHNT